MSYIWASLKCTSVECLPPPQRACIHTGSKGLASYSHCPPDYKCGCRTGGGEEYLTTESSFFEARQWG